MAGNISVEVVFALADRQVLVDLALEEGASVAEAIDHSGIGSKFPDHDLDSAEVGIWGHPVDRQRRLKDGDRVEIYRPLRRDPRDARRELASAGKTMRGPSGR